MLVIIALSAFFLVGGVNGHLAAWAKGMYCSYVSIFFHFTREETRVEPPALGSYGKARP